MGVLTPLRLAGPPEHYPPVLATDLAGVVAVRPRRVFHCWLRNHQFLPEDEDLLFTAARFQFGPQGLEIAFRCSPARGKHANLAVDVRFKLNAAAADATYIERPGGIAAEVALKQLFQ